MIEQDPMKEPMGLIKRTVPIAALAAAALLAPLTAFAAEDEWVFDGGGWGHGVGLSQYGALGQAQDGRNATQILKHYYQGTGIGSVGNHWTTNEDGLWVGIAPNTTTVTLIAVGGPVTVCIPEDDCETEEQINPGETWRFEVNSEDSSECRLRQVGGDHTGWSPCSASLSDISPSNRVSVNGIQYARGTVRFDPSSDGFHAVVTLDLERYLYGLDEVPFDWHSTALQVQAIAGRSYAVATAKQHGGGTGNNKRPQCGCHLLSTILDQVYRGYTTELKASANRWKDAVDATDGKVVTYNNATIRSFYSSSNGGASENNEDVWPGGPIPYLRSVSDPWSADPSVNPLATWSVKVRGSDLAKELGWDRALDARIIQGPPGVIIEFTGVKNGQVVTLTRNGTQTRALLGKIGFGYHAPGSPNSSAVRASPYISTVNAPPAFIDIIGNTFEKDIEWLASEDITRGCNPPENSRFCPDDHVTRGQMAAFLNRFLNLPPATESHFNDISGNTFENDINRLAEAGITKGCNPPDNTRFCPNDRVTREQMAAFLVRALELTANTHDGFNDVSSSNTFHGDIGRMATAGITRGCNPPQNTNYCPKDFITRGQMAAFLHRSDDLR